MRVNHVEHARKSPGKCGKCDKEIPAGAGYRWIKPRYGAKQIRCMDCPTWKQSELTTSDKLSRLYAVQENLESAVSEWDREDAETLRDALHSAADEVREVAQEYRDSAQNIEDGFGHSTSKSDELNERGDEVEAWADTLDGAAEDIVDFDADEAREEAQEDVDCETFPPAGRMPGECHKSQAAADDFNAKTDDRVSEKRDEWADEQETKVNDAAGEMP